MKYLIGPLLLASCVAQEATLNQSRVETADGFVRVLEALENPQGAAEQRVVREDATSARDAADSTEQLLEWLASLGRGGSAVLVSRLLSNSKPRINELDRRLAKVENPQGEKDGRSV